MKTIYGVGALALSLLVFAMPATAADGWYVSGSGGLTTVQDSSSRATITAGSGKGDVTFDEGFGFAGSIGHASGPIRLEVELSYRKNDLDYVNVTTVLAGTILFPNAGTYALVGDVSTFGFMANGFYDFDTGSEWAPFLMAGLGGARVNVDVDTVNGVSATYEQSDAVIAYQVGAGIGYNLASATSVNLQYRFMGTSNPEFDDGTVVIDGEYQTHNFWVGFTKRF